MTYTYAILDVSRAAFDEIKAKLDAAGYQHMFHGDAIDMHGVALRAVVTDLDEHASDCDRRKGLTCDCGRDD